MKFHIQRKKDEFRKKIVFSNVLCNVLKLHNLRERSVLFLFIFRLSSLFFVEI